MTRQMLSIDWLNIWHELFTANNWRWSTAALHGQQMLASRTSSSHKKRYYN